MISVFTVARMCSNSDLGSCGFLGKSDRQTVMDGPIACASLTLKCEDRLLVNSFCTMF
jgi:hypothetical protein